MTTRLYAIILGILVVLPPVVVTVIEQVIWAKKPPVGEINGLPSALLALLTIPAILICGGAASLVLKLFKRGGVRNYLLAFIAPSIIHALIFVLATLSATSSK